MERFLKISEGITRCTYAPGAISDKTLIVNPAAATGTPVEKLPIPTLSVQFTPRPVYHTVPDGEPQIRVIQTVDGQRTVIENLKEVHDRDAWRAEIRFSLQPGEHLYGLGQDEDGVFDKRGRMEYVYQHNMRIAVPMVVSSLGYAILADCGCLMTLDGWENPAVWTLECVEQADLYILQGSMDEIVAAYRKLTGRASPMPDWVWGYWQSKEKYTTQKELLQVARWYRDEKIPLDVVVQDWKTWVGDLWGDKHLDTARYPDVEAMRREMDKMHVHTLVSVWPNMNDGGEDHREFADKGWLLGDYSTYDAFNADARKLYWDQAARELHKGFDGWWCDSNEPFTSPDWCGEQRLPEAERYRIVGGEHEKYLDPAVSCLYGLEHARGIYENQPDKPVVNLTRSGWAGIQKYGAILWAGDTSATWRELRREIAKGLSVGLCGIPYWTVDAGAFFAGGTACWRKWKGDSNADPVWFWHGDYDGGVADLGYQELYTRWLQFACFMPIFRSHGTDTPREVWNFAEPFRSTIAETIRLRYRLMPYIQDMARKVVDEDFTIMRSLLFDFPEEPESAVIDDEFLFGTDLLICPVTEPMYYGPGSTPLDEKPTIWKCWLPRGTDWYDFWTGEGFAGGQLVEMPLTLEHIPVFVRAGTELPMTEGRRYAADSTPVTKVWFPHTAARRK